MTTSRIIHPRVHPKRYPPRAQGINFYRIDDPESHSFGFFCPIYTSSDQLPSLLVARSLIQKGESHEALKILDIF